MKWAALAVLLFSAISVCGDSYTLTVSHDLERRVELGEHTVTAQILDASGMLQDVDSMRAEVVDPYNNKAVVPFHRKSLGTYEGVINIAYPNIHYVTFIPEKPGFSFNNLETTVYGNKAIVTDWSIYLLPASIAIVAVAAGYFLLSRRG